MSLVFTQFLISYTERFFLKATDALGLSISIIALFVSMAAIVMSLSIEFSKDKGVQIVVPLPTIAAIILTSSLILVWYIVHRHYKNNQNVFEIEKIIFLKSDQLDQLEIKYKEIILDEVKRFYTTRGKNFEKLKSILMNPETLLNSISESPSDKSQAKIHSRWLCKRYDGEEQTPKLSKEKICPQTPTS